MVNITRFKADKHMEALKDMHKSHNYSFMSDISEDGLPKIGFIVYSNTEFQYIAAAFLRIVEGGYAQVDTIVSNPMLTADVRHEGINLLANKLIETAKELKLKAIYAFTVDKSIIVRAKKAGFSVIDHMIIARKF